MSVQEDMAIDITRQLIDSLFGSDSDEKPIKKANKFSDGLSLIRAFSSLQRGENLKSPLKTVNTNSMDKKWQIWYWKPTNRQAWNWEDFLQMKTSFSTKEEFWRCYDELKGFEFGLLGSHFNYCVFREGVKPMWEDPANRGGGRWVLEFPRKKDWRHISHLNDIWLKLLLSITGYNGSSDDYINEICGAVLMIRHNVNKIAVWTKNADNTLKNLKIGQTLKASTGFGGKMFYTNHKSNDQKIVVNREKKIRFKENSSQ